MYGNASELFREPMATWGLRGDPYLWDALSRRLGGEPLPASAESLVALLDREFRALTGQGIAAERDAFVEEFAHGGMSSGHVCASYWRETAIPLLVERLQSLQAGKPPTRQCGHCGEVLPGDCFRKGSPHCVWCVFEPKQKRAGARYSDKLKAAAGRLRISREDFVRWYTETADCCAYCGLSYRELRELRVLRKGGYCVSWDIDRRDSSGYYEAGNLALSCFVCNMAKGDMLSADEAMIVGRAVRQVWEEKLDAVRREREVRSVAIADMIAAASANSGEMESNDGHQ